MRAYLFAALVVLTGCRDLVRELLKEDHPSESYDPAATASPPAATPTPPPWPDDPPPKASAPPAVTATATAKKAQLPATGGNCTNVCEKSLKCEQAGKPMRAQSMQHVRLGRLELLLARPAISRLRRVLLPAGRPRSALGLKRDANDATSTP